MLKYPLSTLLYLAKINIKDTIQDALKLKNNIDIRLTITVKDKNGKIIRQHKQRSHSFVSNFLAIISSLLTNQYSQSYNYYYIFRNTAGSYETFPTSPSYTNIIAINSVAGDTSYGIVVGTGTATPTPNDYNLGNKILNGTGSGQLEYSAHTFTPNYNNGTYNSSSPTSIGVLPVLGNTTSIQISRQFTNQSGASITVSEVGIITLTSTEAAITDHALIIHDLLSSPVTVPNLSILQITYTISVTT